MKAVVIVVENGCNAANPFTAAPGKKKVRRGMQEKRILLLVEQLFHIGNERRNPIKIIPIDFPGKMDKSPKSAVAIHWNYFNLGQGTFPFFFTITNS